MLGNILSRLPVHWRFFVKTKLFECVARADAPANRPWVKKAFEELCGNYPELAAIL
jgi:hypothetical protein